MTNAMNRHRKRELSFYSAGRLIGVMIGVERQKAMEGVGVVGGAVGG